MSTAMTLQEAYADAMSRWQAERARAEAAEAEVERLRALVADALVLLSASPRFGSTDPWVARARAALAPREAT